MTFSDGMKFNLSGPLRITSRSDGLYVVGQGQLIPINSYDEGKKIIQDSLPKPR